MPLPHFRQAVVKTVDMSEEMMNDAIDVATALMLEHNKEADLAFFIKKDFDRKYRCARIPTLSSRPCQPN